MKTMTRLLLHIGCQFFLWHEMVGTFHEYSVCPFTLYKVSWYI